MLRFSLDARRKSGVLLGEPGETTEFRGPAPTPCLSSSRGNALLLQSLQRGADFLDPRSVDRVGVVPQLEQPRG
jgi:hypothetical protein